MDRNTREPETFELPPDRILVDPDLQPRVGGLDAEHVAALQENPEAWSPLAVIDDGGYLLVDGFHRLAAAQNLGLETVAVEVRTAPEDGDLKGLAFTLIGWFDCANEHLAIKLK